MKSRVGMGALLMTWVVILPVFASLQQRTSAAPGQQAAQEAVAEPSTEAILYKNTKYGFTFALPKEWKGYSIVTDEWEASDTQKGGVERGPMIRIRHPDWTKENPRQDIPIMVYTVAQWTSVEQGDFYVGGAAIGAGELGRNRKYVFALPPRYSNADVAGVKEVDEIFRHSPLRPIWSK